MQLLHKNHSCINNLHEDTTFMTWWSRMAIGLFNQHGHVVRPRVRRAAITAKIRAQPTERCSLVKLAGGTCYDLLLAVVIVICDTGKIVAI